ncbi:gluconokinase [Enterovibrio makurazakiensis]|uniref:Gluconokinase n=1 Tax=Enterovibrio gelatinilyticus TaxID=2899819 RepID=A0ABT5R2I8_9GAMM|nr:gluconokinase [Enterovibrio sp. ZSDZ42]MDD1793961.1 gluconokinase [Enterovibrio sp. ZSDZ42]
MKPKKILLMGVSGSGKSLIGSLVAQRLDIPFYDGDDYHPEENVKKMRQGIPLSDTDRQGWLRTLNTLFIKNDELVVACSALKKEYRDTLRQNNEGMTIVFLRGDFDTIWSRHQKRTDHYFKGQDMLKSQFETLVEPTQDEAVFIDITHDADEVVNAVMHAIGKSQNSK